MKLYLFLILALITSCRSAQQAQSRFADMAFVYKGFGSGGTTANLWNYSVAVDTMKHVPKVQLDATSLDTLNLLLAQIKSKKHFQQKVGRSFYATIIKEGQETRLAVVPGWAIIDLRAKREYIFRNTEFAEIYNRFVERNFR